jgi:ferredoxin
MTDLELDLNPIACRAHGLCAELLPEWITVDDWGYPILRSGPLPADLIDLAQRAAKVCPTLALRVRIASREASESRPRTTGSALRPGRRRLPAPTAAIPHGQQTPVRDD